MSLLKIAPGVTVNRQVYISAGVINAANVLGLQMDMRITSGNDKQHMEGSLHGKDRALDFRTKHLTADQKHMLVDQVRIRLGIEYDVILESEDEPNEHLHVEYDPK